MSVAPVFFHFFPRMKLLRAYVTHFPFILSISFQVGYLILFSSKVVSQCAKVSCYSLQIKCIYPLPNIAYRIYNCIRITKICLVR
jgi:hypothetical protein